MSARPTHYTAATIPTPRVVKLLGADARLPSNDGDLTRAEVDAMADDLSDAAVIERADSRAVLLESRDPWLRMLERV